MTGYVVVPQHVHLLISEPPGKMLFEALKTVKVSVAKRSQERPFWQARYYDFNVFTGHKITEKLKYADNPRLASRTWGTRLVALAWWLKLTPQKPTAKDRSPHL